MRLFPARPMSDDEVLLELEKSIPDTFIGFQGVGNALLVILAEAFAPTAVLKIDGASGFDPDEMEFALLSGERVGAAELMAAAAKIPLPVEEYAVILPGAALPRVSGLTGPNGREVLLYADAATFAREALTRSGKGGFTLEQINKALEDISPSSSKFIPGEVTSAQKKWREGEVAGSEPARVAIPVEIPQVDVTALEERMQTAQVPVPARKTVDSLENAEVRVSYTSNLAMVALGGLVGNTDVYLAGVRVDLSLVTAPDGLLPVLLVAAAEAWGPIVVRKSGKGGFDIRLERDPQAVVGFRVVDVIPSAPLLLMIPLVRQFSTVFIEGDYILDDLLNIFLRWAQKYDLVGTELEEIEVNIALRSVDE